VYGLLEVRLKVDVARCGGAFGVRLIVLQVTYPMTQHEAQPPRSVF
jgi:hypothetical protein